MSLVPVNMGIDADAVRIDELRPIGGEQGSRKAVRYCRQNSGCAVPDSYQTWEIMIGIGGIDVMVN